MTQSTQFRGEAVTSRFKRWERTLRVAAHVSDALGVAAIVVGIVCAASWVTAAIATQRLESEWVLVIGVVTFVLGLLSRRTGRSLHEKADKWADLAGRAVRNAR
jgi:general stress protein CsbA